MWQPEQAPALDGDDDRRAADLEEQLVAFEELARHAALQRPPGLGG